MAHLSPSEANSSVASCVLSNLDSTGTHPLAVAAVGRCEVWTQAPPPERCSCWDVGFCYPTCKQLHLCSLFRETTEMTPVCLQMDAVTWYCKMGNFQSNMPSCEWKILTQHRCKIIKGHLLNEYTCKYRIGPYIKAQWYSPTICSWKITS